MQKERFSDLEGSRVAAEIEKRGGAFYQLAARVSRSEETKALLSALAADEEVHLREFQALYQREAARADAGSQYPAELGAYLAALAAEIAFPEGVVGMARHLESREGILKESIRSEEESIRFYEEMLGATKSEETARVFGDIIAQEKGHLAKLTAMLSEVEGKGE